ncbi:hypothetical protein QWT36_23665, partial [Salmonella enterica subsp. enterica serovar Typhi]|nr:hypothetical protein [Salmonella enterica subsp. enterica serovar Typhi]
VKRHAAYSAVRLHSIIYLPLSTCGDAGKKSSVSNSGFPLNRSRERLPPNSVASVKRHAAYSAVRLHSIIYLPLSTCGDAGKKSSV